MGEAYRIRTAGVGDAAALAEIGAATFTEAFREFYAAADLKAFLAENHSVDWYRATVARSDKRLWLAETPAGDTAAYALAGACDLPLEDEQPGAGELKRIYVRQGRQGAGLGQRLLDTALDWLHGEGYAPLYIGVFSENLDAQRLYARAGFEKVGEYYFKVGEHLDHEYILKLKET